MARQISRRSYGRTSVSGRAKVQLGDLHTTKNYSVGAVNVALSEDVLNLLRDLVTNEQLHPGPGLSSSRIAKQLKSSESCKARHKSGIAGTSCLNAEEVDVGDAKLTFQDILLQVQRWVSESWSIPAVFAKCRTTTCEHDLALQAPTGSNTHCEQALIKAESERAVVRENLMLGAGLLSWVIGRNVSAADLIIFLSKCGSDEFSPLLLMIFCIGIYRYFTMRSVCRAPAQTFWKLEDAYGFSRQISMDVLVDYSIVQIFLKNHYRDAQRLTGVAFIQNDQFHLMLGSRRGIVIGNTNWERAMKIIKPGYTVVNSFYVTMHDKICLTCKSALIVTNFGEFYCATCETLHRDYSTFDLSPSRQRPPQDLPQRVSESSSTVAAPVARQISNLNDETDEQILSGDAGRLHDLDGVRNLNIRLLPKLKLNDIPTITDKIFSHYPLDDQNTATGLDFADPAVQIVYVETCRFGSSPTFSEDNIELPAIQKSFGFSVRRGPLSDSSDVLCFFETQNHALHRYIPMITSVAAEHELDVLFENSEFHSLVIVIARKKPVAQNSGSFNGVGTDIEEETDAKEEVQTRKKANQESSRARKVERRELQSDSKRILKRMKELCGRMHGILFYRLIGTTSWHSGYCAINTMSGSLVRQTIGDPDQVETLIPDLRGCTTLTVYDPSSKSTYLSVALLESEHGWQLRPSVPEALESWLAALLHWKLPKTERIHNEMT